MTVKPRNGHILLAKCEDPRSLKSKEGIDLIEGQPTDSGYGVVEAIDESSTAPHICKVGDIVYYRISQLSGAHTFEDGEVMYALRECLVLHVVDDVPAVRIHNRARSRAEVVAEMNAKEASQNATPKLVIAKG